MKIHILLIIVNLISAFGQSTNNNDLISSDVLSIIAQAKQDVRSYLSKILAGRKIKNVDAIFAKASSNITSLINRNYNYLQITTTTTTNTTTPPTLTATACQYGTVSVTCPSPKTIVILSAMYGPGCGSCGSCNGCFNQNVIKYFMFLQGQTSGSKYIDNGGLRIDPCYGYNKIATLTYQCK